MFCRGRMLWSFVNRCSIRSLASCSNLEQTKIRIRLCSFIPHVHKSLVSCRRHSSQSAVETTDVNETQTDVSIIANGDVVLEKKLKILMLEVDVWRQGGERVPDFITTEQWRTLLTYDTISRRRRYLTFLFKIERKQENRKLKKVARQEERAAKVDAPPEDGDGHIKYGLGENTFLLRIYDSTIDKFYNGKLMQAMMFSQDIVLDCSYDEYMTVMEAHNCAKQICFLFAENRTHDDPFNIQLCNADPNSVVMKKLLRYIPNVYEEHFPLNVTPKSYLDLYPKEKLVYLTPHCRADLGKDYDHDSVYIIGAMVDKSNHDPISLAKAKKEGLRMAKLPIDQYLYWGSGGCKNLTINQMVKIMLDWRHTNDWEVALKHVPRRKIVTDERLQQLNPNLLKKEALMKRHEQRNKPNYKKKLDVRSLFNE